MVANVGGLDANTASRIMDLAEAHRCANQRTVDIRTGMSYVVLVGVLAAVLWFTLRVLKWQINRRH